MKLKSKIKIGQKGEVGAVVELLAIAYDSSSNIILFVEVDNERMLCKYNSLAKMNEEWEDYDEAEKPALTKEERSYLIAWLKMLGCTKYAKIERKEQKLQLVGYEPYGAAVPTFGRFKWWPEGKSYTIEELEL